MAGNRIKGITIEIGGDTTKLDKALTGTNDKLKGTQSALKDVNRLLKLDPGNTILLEQKQRLLAQASETAAEKVKTLEDALEGAREALERGNAYDKLSADLDAAKRSATEAGDALLEAQKKLNSLHKTKDPGAAEQVQALGEEIERLSATVDGADAQVRTLQKSLDDIKGPRITQDQFDALQRELVESGKAAEDAGKNLDDFSAKLDTMSRKAEQVSTGAGKVKDAFAPVSKAIGVIGAAAIATLPATDELRTGLSRLDTTAQGLGVGVGAARKAFEDFYVVSGEVDSSIEAVSNLLNAGFNETSLQIAVEQLSSAVLQFPDTLKIESLADSLQETLAQGEATGQFAEMLERLGGDIAQFNAHLRSTPNDAEAVAFVLGALEEQLGRGTYDAWVKNNEALVEGKEASLELQQSMAQLAQSIQPMVTQILQVATQFLDWFNSLDEGTKGLIINIGALLFAISPIAGLVEGISTLLPNLLNLIQGTNIQTVLAVGGFLALAAAATAVLDAWDDMSGLERAISVIGLLAVAVGTLAIALGAVSGPVGIALAAGGIAAGVVAVAGAINSANKRAESGGHSSIPAYAEGGVIPPNHPYMALVGDNKKEPEIIAPESKLHQMALEAAGRGRNRPSSMNLTMNVDGATFARLLLPYLDGESARRGVSVVSK